MDQSKPLIGKEILFNDNLILNFLINEIAFPNKVNFENIKNTNSKFYICKSKKNKNELELCFIWDNEQNKNLKVGDKIVKIDEFDTQKITDSTFCELKNYIRAKSVINVTFKRGNKEFTTIIDLQ